MIRLRTLCWLALTAFAAAARPLVAQSPSFHTEAVTYRNERDSTTLTAALALPTRTAPGPGVVLVSVAFTDPLVEALTRQGYTVLLPERRWLHVVPRLLRTSLAELSSDVQTAVDYLHARPEVGDREVAVIAQGDDAQAALLAVGASAAPVPLVMLAGPVFTGAAAFRLDQHGIAQVEGYNPEMLRQLDTLLDRIALAVLEEPSETSRADRLETVIGGAEVRLPHNAAFPDDEAQVHVFSSPWWADYLGFDPAPALARLHAPVLMLVGDDDPFVPLDRYLPAARSALAAARTRDASVCLVYGRTRQVFTDASDGVIAGWLAERFAPGEGPDAARPLPAACLPDPKEKK